MYVAYVDIVTIKDKFMYYLLNYSILYYWQLLQCVVVFLVGNHISVAFSFLFTCAIRPLNSYNNRVFSFYTYRSIK